MLSSLNGKSIVVTANSNASNRTKNRLREHGDSWTVKNAASDVAGLVGECILLHRPEEKFSWFGWLPLSEINIEIVG